MADKKKPRKAAGPPPDSLAIEGDWQAAMKKALAKSPPKNGLPERPTQKRQKRKGHPE